MSDRPDLERLRCAGRYDHPFSIEDCDDAADWIEAVEDVLRLYVQTGGRCGAEASGYLRCGLDAGHGVDHLDSIGVEWNDDDPGAEPSPWTAERLAVLHAVTNPD
jgi:hypothetical protein